MIRSPEKKLLETMLIIKMADSDLCAVQYYNIRPCDRDSTLV